MLWKDRSRRARVVLLGALALIVAACGAPATAPASTATLAVTAPATATNAVSPTTTLPVSPTAVTTASPTTTTEPTPEPTATETPEATATSQPEPADASAWRPAVMGAILAVSICETIPESGDGEGPWEQLGSVIGMAALNKGLYEALQEWSPPDELAESRQTLLDGTAAMQDVILRRLDEEISPEELAALAQPHCEALTAESRSLVVRAFEAGITEEQILEWAEEMQTTLSEAMAGISE